LLPTKVGNATDKGSNQNSQPIDVLRQGRIDAYVMSTTLKPNARTSTEPVVRRWPAVLTLALIAPLIAEVGVGSIPVSGVWMLLFFGYTTAQARCWSGKLCAANTSASVPCWPLGWPTDLSRKDSCPVADWAPRLLGFNSAFSLWVLLYHAVFSIAAPIVMVDLIFPQLRNGPYLRTGGLVVWAVALLVGLGVVRLSLIWMDPRHVDSAPHLIAVGVLVAALVAWGLRTPQAARRDCPVPRPWSLVVLGSVGVAGYFALLMRLPGARHSAYLSDDLAWLAPVLAMILLAVASVLCNRWSTSARWSPGHGAALIAGALPAHSLFGLFVLPLATLDRILLAVIIAVEVGVGVWLVRRARASVA
jgi:hypothetical protein